MQIALVSTSSIVARVHATIRSAFEVSPTCAVHVLDLDGSYLPLGAEQVVTPVDIGVDTRDRNVRGILLEPEDLARWMQPALLRHALRRGSTVLAVRAGVLFLRDPAELADLADEYETCLISRCSETPPLDGGWPGPADLLATGSYTPHLVGVSRRATAFLNLWEQLAADPLTASDRWIDVAASQLPHHSVTGAARFLVSAWTVPAARIGEAADGTLEADGAPAVAVDLTGINPDTPWLLDTIPHGPPRIRLSAHPGLARVAAGYAAEVRADRAGQLPPAAPPATALGVTAPELRVVFRDALQQSPTRSIEALPDPFDADLSEEVTSWLIQPSTSGSGSDLGVGRYLASIYRSRPDLRAIFPGVPGEHVGHLLQWAEEHGRHDVAYSPALIDLALRALNSIASAPEPDPEPDAERDAEPDAERELAPAEDPPPAVRAPGVNVVGYLRGELGVGESARLMLSALTAAGIPHATTSVDRHLQSRQGASYESTAADEPFDTTLLCVNADMTSTIAASVPSLLTPSQRIGMWYWEVEDFPASQHEGFRQVDEVWVASDFVRRAIEPHSPVPVRTITPPLPQPHAVNGLTRADLGLPQRPFFLFAFDYLSTAERKNPWGLVDAFEAAFPPGEGPLLVIKSINGDKHLDQAERLRLRVAGSTDILLLEEYLNAEDRDALMALCDCYVSLHRSEGLGLTMAEAMALGKPVIATGYSGNLQFMTEANSFLVPWNPTVIPAGCEPYPRGGTWAEPDCDAAARLMRTVFADRKLAASRGRQGAEDLRTLHSPEAAGRVISARLAELETNRRAELEAHRLAELEDERLSRKRRGARDQLSTIRRRIRRA